MIIDTEVLDNLEEISTKKIGLGDRLILFGTQNGFVESGKNA